MSITSINTYALLKESPSLQQRTPVADVQLTPDKLTERPQPNVNEMQAAVENLNKFIAPAVQTIAFSIDHESGKTIVKVLDAETQKVLRQIPNAEVLAISKTLDKLQGLIFHQKA